MAHVELIMPKMGESVAEATIISWQKEVGETIEIDETVVEIATDKVDSEVPSSVEGVLVKKLFEADDVVKVGEVFAIVETEGGAETTAPVVEEAPAVAAAKVEDQVAQVQESVRPITNEGSRFYSPLVRSISSEEGISLEELEQVPGTGKGGRVTKEDILAYVNNRGNASDTQTATAPHSSTPKSEPTRPAPKAAPAVSLSGDSEVIEMDRMRKLIASPVRIGSVFVCSELSELFSLAG